MNGDYPGGEFYLGGTFIKQMGETQKEELKKKGASLFRMADGALAAVSREIVEIDFLQSPE